MRLSICVRSHQLPDALGNVIDRGGSVHAFGAGARRSGGVLDGDRAFHRTSGFAAQNDARLTNLCIARECREYPILRVSQELRVDRGVQ
jgi:hypothetical protein